MYNVYLLKDQLRLLLQGEAVRVSVPSDGDITSVCITLDASVHSLAIAEAGFLAFEYRRDRFFNEVEEQLDYLRDKVDDER